MARPANTPSVPAADLEPAPADLVETPKVQIKRENENITAPGEARAGAEVGQFKASGNFLVFDPYTLDCVGEDGGEMRVTQFVRDRLEDGKLVKA